MPRLQSHVPHCPVPRYAPRQAEFGPGPLWGFQLGRLTPTHLISPDGSFSYNHTNLERSYDDLGPLYRACGDEHPMVLFTTLDDPRPIFMGMSLFEERWVRLPDDALTPMEQTELEWFERGQAFENLGRAMQKLDTPMSTVIKLATEAGVKLVVQVDPQP